MGAGPPTVQGGPPGPAPIDGLRFRVTDLRRSVGSRVAERRPVDVAGLSIGEVGAVPDSATAEVTLESLTDGIRAAATVEFDWTGPCRRCLDPARGRTTSELRELFVDDPDRYVAADGEEVHSIDEGWVDLGEVVRDAVLLGLPLAPLCGPRCPGPAPESFPVSVEGSGPPAERESADGAVAEGSAGSEAVDPRWARLSDLRFDPSED